MASDPACLCPGLEMSKFRNLTVQSVDGFRRGTSLLEKN